MSTNHVSRRSSIGLVSPLISCRRRNLSLKMDGDVFYPDKYKGIVDEYLESAFDSQVEPLHVRDKDSVEEMNEAHVKRSELLLKEPALQDPNDYQSNLYARLLTIVREKRVNKYQNRSDEMRDNIRQLFEINTQLHSMINQTKNDAQRPQQALFINSKEFHDESYAEFMENVQGHRK